MGVKRRGSALLAARVHTPSKGGRETGTHPLEALLDEVEELRGEEEEEEDGDPDERASTAREDFGEARARRDVCIPW